MVERPDQLYGRSSVLKKDVAFEPARKRERL
jgi:hypothetical protein